MDKPIVIMILLFNFLLGLYAGFYLVNYLTPDQTLNENPQPITRNVELMSPSDHVKESQIHLTDNRVTITFDRQLSWARFTDSNSMDPVLDTGHNSIEIIPETTEDIRMGDIIAFDYNGDLIVHRVTEIGYDTDGWYATTKGDNNPTADPGKRRFDDIKYVTVMIIY